MKPKSNPKLDVKADDYYALVRQRLGLQEDEKVKKRELIALLKEMGILLYETPEGIVIELKEEEKLTAKKKKEGGDDEPEGELGESDEFDA